MPSFPAILGAHFTDFFYLAKKKKNVWQYVWQVDIYIWQVGIQELSRLLQKHTTIHFNICLYLPQLFFTGIDIQNTENHHREMTLEALHWHPVTFPKEWNALEKNKNNKKIR